MSLITAPNLARPDDTYERLVDAYRHLDASRIANFQARLLLLLMNHIGDHDVIAQAITLAQPSETGARGA